MEDADLDAVPGFPVCAICFAADVVADSGGGHEVAFVGGVDEDFSLVDCSGKGGDLGDAAVGHFDAGFSVEPFVAVDGDVVFADVVFEDALGDAGLEHPHATVFCIDGAGSGAGEVVLFLPAPGVGFLVVLEDALVEVTGESADGAFLSGVGPAESAGGESAKVLVRGDDDD